MKIAVIGVQGDISEHITSLKEINPKGEIIWARKCEDLNPVDAIIIPGGESTTIKRLLILSGMDKVIKDSAKKGIPILGTCAGAILLAKHVRTNEKIEQGLLQLIDMEIDRNSYGRQIDSFEAEITTDIGKTEGVFIRAPLIKKVFGETKIFAKYGSQIIGARHNNIYALTFHPELSDDKKIFQYFLEIVNKNTKKYT